MVFAGLCIVYFLLLSIDLFSSHLFLNFVKNLENRVLFERKKENIKKRLAEIRRNWQNTLLRLARYSKLAESIFYILQLPNFLFYVAHQSSYAVLYVDVSACIYIWCCSFFFHSLALPHHFSFSMRFFHPCNFTSLLLFLFYFASLVAFPFFVLFFVCFMLIYSSGVFFNFTISHSVDFDL